MEQTDGEEGREVKETEEGKCGNCAHGKQKLIRDEDSGFVLCAFMKPWKWIAQRMPCQFDPVRWKRSG